MTDLITASGTTLYWNCSFNQSIDWSAGSLQNPTAKYRVQFGFAKSLIRDDLHDEYKRKTGTVVMRYEPTTFPPLDVVEALSKHYGRPLVGARHSENLEEVEYNGTPPGDPVDLGYYWMCPVWCQQH